MGKKGSTPKFSTFPTYYQTPKQENELPFLSFPFPSIIGHPNTLLEADIDKSKKREIKWKVCDISIIKRENCDILDDEKKKKLWYFI